VAWVEPNVGKGKKSITLRVHLLFRMELKASSLNLPWVEMIPFSGRESGGTESASSAL